MSRGHELKVKDKEEVSASPRMEQSARRRVRLPRTDILELPDKMLLVADMPGVDEKGVEITLEKNALLLHGKVDISVSDRYRGIYSEYEAGDFERSYLLSQEVDRDGIKASIHNGVLEVLLPKSDSAKTRKISVTAH